MTNPKINKPRIFYIDNLRIFLIALVVLHHLAITYGAPGGWFYNESVAEFPEIIPLSMFVATNQAFFMGMFFFVSAYFILPSLRKKGVWTFFKDRLIRLGIPTLIFFFFLFPLTVYFRNNFILDDKVSLKYLIFNETVFGFGPMWFVEALLLFTLAYLLIYQLKIENIPNRLHRLPSPLAIISFACIVGIGQFLIRIWLPVGWAMPFTQFQLPHFLQYIFLFGFGIVAHRHQWLDAISSRHGWRWFLFVQVLIFAGFPILFVLGGAIENGVELFMGGLTWQSFAYAIWEQLVGFGLIMGLLGIFKSKFNTQGNLAKIASASAYAVYVFHTPILVIISVLALNLDIPQIWKFVVLAPVALLFTFIFGGLIKRIPLLKEFF
jgi:peptidoglycan/LPS O-acetylase OafA/YrhL